MNPSKEALIRSLIHWNAQKSEIKQRAIAWLRSDAFRDGYYDDVHAPLTVKVYLEHLHSRRHANQLWREHEDAGIQTPRLWNAYQDLAKDGEVVFGQLIKFSSKAEEDPDHHHPCTALVPLNQNWEAILGSMELAEFLKAYDPKIHPSKKLTRLIKDTRHLLFRRRLLPVNETSEFNAKFLDLHARKSWLPPDEIPFIPILTNPNEEGAQCILPWHVVTGVTWTTASTEEAKFAPFADLDRHTDAELARTKTSFLYQVWRTSKYTLLILSALFLLIVIVTFVINFFSSLFQS